VLVLAGSVLATWRGERGQPDAQAQPEATAVEIAAIER